MADDEKQIFIKAHRILDKLWRIVITLYILLLLGIFLSLNIQIKFIVMKKIWLLVVMAMLSNQTTSAQGFTQVLGALALDKAQGDQFGYSIAVSGDYAVIGAPYKTVSGKSQAGVVYVFRRQSGIWSEVQRIPGSDANNRFGFSVDIDGDYMVIGEPHEYRGSVNAGQMIVYQLNPTTGTFGSAKGITGAGGSQLGFSVAIVDLGNGDAMAVGGAYKGGALGQGEVRVSFKKSLLGGSDWTQGVVVPAPAGYAAGDNFGVSVSASATSVLVGSSNRTRSGISGAGAAYLFSITKNLTINSFEASLTTTFDSPIKATNNYFARSVAINHDESTIVIGEPQADNATFSTITNQGAATIYRKNGNSWLEVKTIDISNGGTTYNWHKDAKFGQHVALDGSRLAIGNYIYAKDLAELNVADQWKRIDSSNGLPLSSSDISGDAFLVGMSTHTSNRGTAFFNEQPPVVYIPDVKFKRALLTNTSVNLNSDTEIQVTEANNFSGTMNVINKQIQDFTGLEAFTSMTGLQCSYNRAPLDVTKNVALTDLRCYGNQLTTLDLSKNVALDYLDCHSNDLASLDFSQNSVLRSVQCKDNLLTSLDISQNSKLTFLRSENNQLTSLNLANGKNADLTLYTAGNPNLSCIQVDDAVASTTDWTAPDHIDATASFSEDCAAPTVVISSAINIAARLQAKGPGISTSLSPYPVNITFSKKVVGFTVGDITTTNATLSNFQSTDDITYTADVSPTADGEVTLLVPAGVAKDVLDQDNEASNSFRFNYTTPDPVTVSVTAENMTTNLSPYPVTITFDQEVTGFSKQDISVTNGSVGNVVTTDNIIYTADVSPFTDGLVEVKVLANTVKGEYNQDNTVSNTLEFTYTSASSPTVSVSSTAGAVTSLSSYPVGVTFSEKVTGFDLADMTVTNGTASNLKTSDGIVYAAEIEPAAEGKVTVSIQADVATSLFDLGNTKSDLFEFTYTAQLVTGIQENIPFSIYPNPASNEFFVRSSGSDISKISVINFAGIKVKKIRFQGNKVDISDLHKGVYMIQLDTNKGAVYKRFVKN